MPLDDPALRKSIAKKGRSVRALWEHTFVQRRHQRYDWAAIRRSYESGRSARQCMDAFTISKGAWYYAVKRGDVVLRDPGTANARTGTRDAVEALLAEGFSQAQIAERLGVSRPTVCFHVRRLGIPPHAEFVRQHDWDAIRAFYEAGNSFRDCLARFGFSRSAWYDAIARGSITPRPRLEPIEQVLAGGRRRNRYHVKTRLLLAKLKEPRCEECGLDEWRARPISLELHHVNGDGMDNRLENLRLLCPTVTARPIHGADATKEGRRWACET